MNMKRILGIIVFIAGLAAILTASYIKKQVEEGKWQISSAQQKVDTANSLFSLNPTTKQVGKGLTAPAQGKINEGQSQVAYYESVEGWLKIGGAVLMVIGAGLVIFGGRKK
jgi:hypothetical protein